ncbi:MAG: CoA pyrophosphatase [Veillonellaceae bacterium]|jgi:coenzyme A diphosphatase NUDT7|nr:CoA pyrophosphatase [Veillonellaceae bacterium]
MTDGFITALSYALSQNRKNDADSYAFFRAAVLIPLIVNKGELQILFEVRSKRLNWQPGEICFPGGKIDRMDCSPVDAAVRETVEELGVRKEQIKIIGSLDEIISPIGVRLYPAVGQLRADSLSLNKAEVAEVFTVPIKWLLDAKPKEAIMEMGTKPLKDFPFELLPEYPATWRARRTYPVLFYQYNNYVIWGITAYVLNKFVNMIKDAPDYARF